MPYVEEFFSRANKILTTASELWEGAGIDPAPFCFLDLSEFLSKTVRNCTKPVLFALQFSSNSLESTTSAPFVGNTGGPPTAKTIEILAILEDTKSSRNPSRNQEPAACCKDNRGNAEN